MFMTGPDRVSGRKGAVSSRALPVLISPATSASTSTAIGSRIGCGRRSNPSGFGHCAQRLMIGGARPGEPGNFLIATSLSGHGLQHAPAAVGRSFTPIDLSGAPHGERGWKA